MSTLFGRFLLHPFQVGACCASSRALARAMTSGIGLENAGTVVELGPGTGVITREIVARLSERGRLLAVELDPALADMISGRYPSVIVACGCASRIGEYLKENSLSRPQAIVSGLPWAVFPEELQDKILNAVVDVLPEGGLFTTFMYVQSRMLPTGKHFLKKLEQRFAAVTREPLVWCNVPPAFVYRARKGK